VLSEPPEANDPPVALLVHCAPVYRPAASPTGRPRPGANIDIPTMVFYGGEGSLACHDRLTVDRSEYAEFAGVDHYVMATAAGRCSI
jgi:hypothetical protein